MRNFILIIILMNCRIAAASEFLTIQLEKDEKFEGSFSAELGSSRTIHFALIKNSETKLYNTMAYLINSDKSFKKLDGYFTKRRPNIISYHSDGAKAVFIDYDVEGKKANTLSFDLETGKLSLDTHPLERLPENIFRLANQTIFVTFDNISQSMFKKTSNSLLLHTIDSNGKITESRIVIPEEKVKRFKQIMQNSMGYTEIPQAVNQLEFVTTGSIADRKGYFSNGKLIYTRELTHIKSEEKVEMQIFQFDLANSGNFTYNSVNPNFEKKPKEIGTYLFEDKLLLLSREKEELRLKVFETNGFSTMKDIAISAAFANQIPKDKFDLYLDNVSKSGREATITVNKTTSGHMLIRIDNVSSKDYNYNYDWFFSRMMMHHSMMMQQQQMMSTPAMGGFGPSPSEMDYSIMPDEIIYPYLEILVDENFNSVDAANVEPVFPKIDRKKHIDNLSKDKSLKKVSLAFAAGEIRYVSQHSKTKQVTISIKNL